ncbi:MAG: hypothetical protein ACE5IC_09250 [Candidatus Brocadiales bacterium]
MKGESFLQNLPILRLIVGMAILLITLPEVAMPHEGGAFAIDVCTDNPYTDHHCPVNTSEPTHHCPQCCVLSHSFTNETSQNLSFSVSDDCGAAVVFERIALSNLLPDTIFHPPENL